MSEKIEAIRKNKQAEKDLVPESFLDGELIGKCFFCNKEVYATVPLYAGEFIGVDETRHSSTYPFVVCSNCMEELSEIEQNHK